MSDGRIVVDLSSFRDWRQNSARFTGIPRVIFETATRLVADEHVDTILTYYDVGLGRFAVGSTSLLERLPDPSESGDASPATSRDWMAGPRRIWYGSRRMRQVLRRIPGARPAYRALRRRYAQIRGATPLELRPTDTLLLLGSLWGMPAMVHAVAEEKRRVGFSVATLIYDIIPVDYPQFFPPETSVPFEHFLREALRFSDQIFTISEATKMAVSAYCMRSSIPLPREVIAAALGDGYEGAHEQSRPNRLPEGDFVIAVSTFEPRKNYQVLYQAVKYAQSTALRIPMIVIVGSAGWLTGDLQRIIRTDPTVKASLVWLDHVSDNELAWLYTNSLFTVFPSIVEGWGLPVSESIHFGKFCIASDQASIPEIAGELIEYVSPYDAAEWATSIARLTEDRVLLNQLTDRLVREYHPRTWESFVDVLKTGIEGLHRASS